MFLWSEFIPLLPVFLATEKFGMRPSTARRVHSALQDSSTLVASSYSVELPVGKRVVLRTCGDCQPYFFSNFTPNFSAAATARLMSSGLISGGFSSVPATGFPMSRNHCSKPPGVYESKSLVGFSLRFLK